MDHVAILRKAYLRAIIEGRKRVEARLSFARRAPFQRVAVADRIFLKACGGGFEGLAFVDRVLTVDRLHPAEVRRLRSRFGRLIQADEEFWRSRLACRYATLIWLSDVRECRTGPGYRDWPGYSPRAGWICAPRESGSLRRSA